MGPSMVGALMQLMASAFVASMVLVAIFLPVLEIEVVVESRL
jgi:hypothetical protein